MTYLGLFIDDQEDVYAEVLTSRGTLEFEFVPVQEVAALARSIFRRGPNIVALDYRLDEAPTGVQPDQHFKGSALAQHLRDEAIDHPSLDFAMVLVSAESKIKNLYRPDKTAHDLFDRVYVKEEINQKRADVRAQMVDLSTGYAVLRAAEGRYELLRLLDGQEADAPYVGAQELRSKLASASAPHLAARVIFELIDRPGPIIDLQDACGYLGINPKQSPDIERVLRDAGIRYNGLFASAWPRWWMNRLEAWAKERFGRRATGVPASERANLLAQTTGLRCEPARSPWNGSPDELISFACASCRRGTELRHSVAAFELALPRHATRRRICWDCVQTDQFENARRPLVIDDADASLAAEVKTMDRGNANGAFT